MTEEQRARLAELRASNAASLAQRAVQNEKVLIADLITDFAEKYAFADGYDQKRVLEFVDGLPFKRPAWIDVERFPRRREYVPGNAEDRRVWICFLAGSIELFQIVVGGRTRAFIDDLDDWDCVCPFTALVYDDLSGFVFIDDNCNMTEVII